jgi:hypothetical protein
MTTEIKYTEHAFERMTERGITRPMVEAVVRCGESQREEIRPQVCKHRLEGLVVVVDRGVVVTVFFDSNTRKRGQWSPKKRQRRCRPGEMKPHYFEGRGKINVRLHAHYIRQMEG